MAKTYVNLKFCGRPVADHQLQLIQELVADFPNLSRSELAATVAELLGWARPSGKPKDVECFYFLEALDEMKLIQLPPYRPGKARGTKTRVDLKAAGQIDDTPLSQNLKQLGAIQLRQVKTRADRQVWKALIAIHHYLGFKVPFGAHLRYFIIAETTARILGCLQFSSPAWKVAARDQWIGWDVATRQTSLPRLVQNSRFLILPWIRVPHLASYVLARIAKQLPREWQDAYGITPLLMETFVDTTRFKGTCYAAANWQCLGETRGRGRMDRHHQNKGSLKSVWVYPLRKNWRTSLLQEGAP